MSDCPETVRLDAFLSEALPPDEDAAIQTHLNACAMCRQRVETRVKLDIVGEGPEEGPFPRMVGRYRLEEKLGQGGMGVVYRAHDTQLDRPVALKCLRDDRRVDPKRVARLVREGRAQAKLKGPEFADIHDVAELEGATYLVMEYVLGDPLNRVLESGPVPATEAARLVRDVAAAMGHAHALGVVHRDLKPSNLVRRPDGRICVLDLGLARLLESGAGAPELTEEGAIAGTPDYMAPEQYADPRLVTPAADVYALGCTLLALLTGSPPYLGVKGLTAKRAAHEGGVVLDELVSDKRVPAELAPVLKRMLSPSPRERSPDGTAAAADLDAFLKAGVANGAVPIESHANARRRRHWPVVLAAATIVGTAVLAFVAFRSPRGSPAASSGTDEGAPIIPSAEPLGPSTERAIDQVMTVARDGTAMFTDLHEALRQATPHTTIRILDGGTYPGPYLLLPDQHAGLTLESYAGAKITCGHDEEVALFIRDVPDVQVLGLGFEGNCEHVYLIKVTGRCPGLLLEGLRMFLPEGEGHAIYFWGQEPEEDDAVACVRRCEFTGGQSAVVVSGFNIDEPSIRLSGQISITDNTIRGGSIGLQGWVARVLISGNVLSSPNSWVYADCLEGRSRDIWIANNSILNARPAFWSRVTIDEPRPTSGLRFVANLLLGSGSRGVWLYEGETDGGYELSDTDGAWVRDSWNTRKNWREESQPGKGRPRAPGWVPPGPEDVLRPKIDVKERVAVRPGFLVPAPGSGPDTGGAGPADPLLPTYAGAVPPDGTNAWDWTKTWDAFAADWGPLPPEDEREAPLRSANRITVAKDYPAQFRSITDALAAAKPGMTIRVLADEEYAEALSFGSDHLNGLTLVAPRGASLNFKDVEDHGIKVQGVRDLTIRGFRLLGHKAKDKAFIYLRGPTPGLVLERLTIVGNGQSTGIAFVEDAIPDTEPPATVRDCELRELRGGVDLLGYDDPNRRVRIEDNRFVSAGLHAEGAARQVLIAGNVFRDVLKSTAIEFFFRGESSGEVLVANNSFFNCWSASGFLDGGPKPASVTSRFSANLIFKPLGSFALAACHPPDVPGTFVKPSDGARMAEFWRLDHNWREGEPANMWLPVPVGPDDRRVEVLEVVSRDPNSPGFLQPVTKSGPDTGGAGESDPTLPPYAGAVPPLGALSWDWSAAWLALAEHPTP